jgi:hypothetical protein
VITRTPEDFARFMRTEKKGYAESLGKSYQGRVAMEVFRALLETTPVLTGRARRNWMPSINEIDETTTTEVAGVLYTGEPLGKSEQQRMQNVLKDLHKMPLGQMVYITNCLDYVYGLDRGTSTKAPHGIVDVAILVAAERVKAGGPTGLEDVKDTVESEPA